MIMCTHCAALEIPARICADGSLAKCPVGLAGWRIGFFLRSAALLPAAGWAQFHLSKGQIYSV